MALLPSELNARIESDPCETLLGELIKKNVLTEGFPAKIELAPNIKIT
jgi:hypothetical protein